MKCENCGGPMVPYMQRQRFCCHACSDEWFMEERRQAIQWWRAMGMKVETKANARAQLRQSADGDARS
jgi:primosomal protein N'